VFDHIVNFFELPEICEGIFEIYTRDYVYPCGMRIQEEVANMLVENSLGDLIHNCHTLHHIDHIKLEPFNWVLDVSGLESRNYDVWCCHGN
jgi:hypothetical protein